MPRRARHYNCNNCARCHVITTSRTHGPIRRRVAVKWTNQSVSHVTDASSSLALSALLLAAGSKPTHMRASSTSFRSLNLPGSRSSAQCFALFPAVLAYLSKISVSDSKPHGMNINLRPRSRNIWLVCNFIQVPMHDVTIVVVRAACYITSCPPEFQSSKKSSLRFIEII